MKQVLAAINNDAFIHRLREEAATAGIEPISILAARQAAEAIKILMEQDIALLLVYLDTMEGAAFQFLDAVDHVKPDVPVIVLMKRIDSEMQKCLEKKNIFRSIEITNDFQQIIHEITDGLRAGSKGHISGVALPTALQMLELERKTCTITVTTENKTGTLFFVNGELIDALFAELTGVEAAMEIVGWDDAEIEFKNFCKRRGKAIREPLTLILMESLRRKDEQESAHARSKAPFPYVDSDSV